MKNRATQAKKSLGQHFLINEATIRAIVNASLPPDGEPLLEIGPGLGALTALLHTQVQRFAAVEIDGSKALYLREKFAGLRVLEEDALTLETTALWDGEPFYAVGNLPYFIASAIIMHYLRQENLIAMTVMVQAEVAERLAAAPGNRAYGILSIAAQLYAAPEILFAVPPTDFRPPPKVNSAVIRLRRRPYPGLEMEPESLLRVVKAAFAQRRKTMANSLSTLPGITKEQAESAIEAAGLKKGVRAEDCSIPELARVAAEIKLHLPSLRA